MNQPESVRAEDGITMPLELVDASIFTSIRAQWGEQCKEYGEIIDEYAVSSMQHAQRIIENGSGTQDYSIFSAVVEGNHECVLHVNRAELPGTVGVTQKVMWVLLAPKYDFETPEPDQIAKIATEVIVGAIELCKKEGTSRHIKIHIGNLSDREFFAGVAQTLRSFGQLQNVSIRGNWLHMSLDKN
jgi:hypothetical protein